MNTSEQSRADALADAETLLGRIRNGYLPTIEKTLQATPMPSGHPEISRAFADIRSLVKHAAAEIDSAFRAVPGLRG